MWPVVFSKNAVKEKSFLKRAGLEKKAKILLSVLLNNLIEIHRHTKS